MLAPEDRDREPEAHAGPEEERYGQPGPRAHEEERDWQQHQSRVVHGVVPDGRPGPQHVLGGAGGHQNQEAGPAVERQQQEEQQPQHRGKTAGRRFRRHSEADRRAPDPGETDEDLRQRRSHPRPRFLTGARRARRGNCQQRGRRDRGPGRAPSGRRGGDHAALALAGCAGSRHPRSLPVFRRSGAESRSS